MDSVDFQVLFTSNIDFEKTIKELIIEVSKEYNDLINEDNIDAIVEVKYTKELSNNRFLIGFKIITEETFSDEELKIFCGSINDLDECEFLIKFEDVFLFDSLKKYYDEIFEIEMQLREILSYIFISTYEDDCFSFLEFQKQKINLTIRGVQEKDMPDFLKNKYQNEFFYLTFNQYRQLKLPDVIKSKTLINLLSDSKSFDEIRKGINKLGAMRPERKEYREFLERISQDLESIETVRNCVAHNREPSDKELENYNFAKGKLQREIDNFFKKKVIFATIRIEEKTHEIGVWRQNSTILEFEDGEEEEIDFGDMEFFGDSAEDTYEEFKRVLIEHLKNNNYNLTDFDSSSIEIEEIGTEIFHLKNGRLV